jgi:hypothetical protein
MIDVQYVCVYMCLHKRKFAFMFTSCGVRLLRSISPQCITDDRNTCEGVRIVRCLYMLTTGLRACCRCSCRCCPSLPVRSLRRRLQFRPGRYRRWMYIELRSAAVLHIASVDLKLVLLKISPNSLSSNVYDVTFVEI